MLICFPHELEHYHLNRLLPSDLAVLGSRTEETDEILGLTQKLEHKDNITIGLIENQQSSLETFFDYILRSGKTDVHMILLVVFITVLLDLKNSSSFTIDLGEKIMANFLNNQNEKIHSFVERNYNAPF